MTGKIQQAYTNAIYSLHTGRSPVPLGWTFSEPVARELVGTGQTAPVRAFDPGLIAPEPWAIVTAYNPGSGVLDEMENRRRQADLLDAVGGMRTLRGVNMSLSGSWVEPTVCVIGIDHDGSLDLGRRFGQNAVVRFDGASIGLLDCRSGAFERLDAWHAESACPLG